MIPVQALAVGGKMRSGIGSARFWLMLGLSFTCSVGFLLLAGILILEALGGHGSQAGNILRAGLAIFSLFLGCFFFVLGTLYRAGLKSARGR